MQQTNKKNLQITIKLGELARKLREQELGLSCAKFADEYDLDRGNLNRLENGRIDSRFTTVWKVAEALGLKLSEFVKILEEELGEDFKLIDE